MSVTFLTNSVSLKIQGQLNQQTNAVNKNYTQLSSGLRINRASDDAAGLSVASRANVDKTVYAQGVRNVNDSISLLSVASNALGEMDNILSRLKELATQASNSTATTAQRSAINEEASSLVSEFNRIAGSTQYNTQSLYDGNFGTLQTQAGYGTQSQIDTTLGEYMPNEGVGELSGSFGYGSANSSSTNGANQIMSVGDFDEDGTADLITGANGGNLFFAKGNGDGTFVTPADLGFSSSATFATADMDNDGHLDIISHDATDIYVSYGNGNGTFTAAASISTGNTNIGSLQVGDLDNSGTTDVVALDFGVAVVSVLNNGSRSYGSTNTVASTPSPPSPQSLVLGQFTGDSYLDVIVEGGATIYRYDGNGDGTLGAETSGLGAFAGIAIVGGDLDGDGDTDLIAAAGSNIRVRLSNGDGTFTAFASYTSAGTGTSRLAIGDINNDGKLDILAADSVGSYLLGNGDGTLQNGVSLGASLSAFGIAVGDFNGDGSSDIVTHLGADFETFLNTLSGEAILGIAELDLSSASSALTAITTIAGYQDSLTKEKGVIGAGLSRLATTTSQLSLTKEGYTEAEDKIRDVDYADQTAQLVKNQILQQTSTALLAQANQQPNVLLGLL